MAIFHVDFENTQEARPVPAGRYEMQITNCETGESGPNSKHPGSPLLKFSLEFTDQSLNAPGIMHYVSLPTQDDENAAFKALMLKRFLVLFHIPFSPDGIDLDNLPMEAQGQTAMVEVSLTPPNDNGDVYNRIVVPKIADDRRR